MTPPLTLSSSERHEGPSAPESAGLGRTPSDVVSEREPVRLELAPVLGLGAVDGAWWPRSSDAAAELIPLLTALGPQTGRPTRVSLNATAWDPGPRMLRAAGHVVRLGWFSHMDPAVVTIAHLAPEVGHGGRRFQDRLRLLVIPPQTSPQQAQAVMSRAGSGTASGTPTDMLLGPDPADGG